MLLEEMMKKSIRLCAMVLTLAMLMCGCGSSGNKDEKEETNATKVENNQENTEDVVEYPYDYASPEFFDIKDCWKYAPTAEVSGVTEKGEPFKLDAVGKHKTMQGGCTDGTYAYFLLEQKNIVDPETGNNVSYCMLFKVDMATWTVVAQSESLPLDHGNGMTYNPKTNQILVAHCQNRTQEFSYVDPDTLTITGRKSLGRNFYSITYNETHDKYVIGIKGTNNFVIYDGAFNKLGEYEGVDPGSAYQTIGYQNIHCDEDYIYILYTGDTQAIMCYDWDGNFCGVYRIDAYQEDEALFHVGDQFYITFYTGSGGRVYKLDFDKDLLF